MRVTDVPKCQMQVWYPRFRRVSLRTKHQTATCPELLSEDYDHWDEEDEDDQEPEIPTFPELEKVIRESIEVLGRAVSPKKNWTAPKDTTWIPATGNLKCQHFGEISLLLKASDSITHDLLDAFDSCEDHKKESPDVVVLALRKWYELRPELEFKAFVFGGLLVGICQREVTKDSRVKLVDFITWAGSTLPLLVTWEELQDNFEKLRANGLVPLPTRQANGAKLDDRTLESSLEKQLNLNSDGGAALTELKLETESSESGITGDQLIVCDAEYKVEFRIVRNEGLVQPGIRVGTCTPIDFIDKGNWEEVIRKEAAEEALQERIAGALDSCHRFCVYHNY